MPKGNVVIVEQFQTTELCSEIVKEAITAWFTTQLITPANKGRKVWGVGKSRRHWANDAVISA